MATTWNPADLTGITLSGGNLVATDNSGAGDEGVRSTTSQSSGKVAFSVTLNSSFAGATGYIGLSQAGQPFSGTSGQSVVVAYLAGTGYFAEDGGILIAGPDNTTTAPTGSDTVTILLDSAGLVYFQCNGNDLFGANPAAGTGGASISAGTWFAHFGSSSTSAAGTANFSPTGLPSGFSAWDGAVTPVNITGTGAIPATSTTATFAGTGVETPVWSLVGISEAAVTASGNYTLTEPAGCQQNDILVVDFAIRSTVIYTNADWIFPQSDSGGNTTNGTTASDTSFESGYCIRGASAPSLVFLRTSGSRALGTIRAYRSNRTGTPSFDTSAKFGQTSASTTITLTGGITTAQDDELLTTGVFLARGATSNNASNMDAVSGITTGSGAKDTTTPPTIGTWIERSDRGNTTSPTVGLACYDGIMGTAGSTGDLSATAASSALNGIIVMAFKHPSGSAAYTLAGAEGSFSISGKAATLNSARKVAGAEGSFAISGQAAALSHGTKLSGAEGSFAISGQSSAGVKALHVGGAEGSFVISGQAAALTYTAGGTAYTLAGGEGSFTISGQPATLNAARKMPGAEGAFVISGQAAGMQRGVKLSGAEGSFVISGGSATLNRAAHLSGEEGSFIISGQPAGLSRGTKLAPVEGSFVISGQSAQFPVALSMKGAEGSFVINGGPATLTYAPSGAPPPVHGNPFFATPGPMTTIQ